VLLPEKLWRDLEEMRAGAPGDSPLFLSREGERLGRVQAWRIVKAAAKRAGLSWKVSPHWMRHYLPFPTMSRDERSNSGSNWNCR